MTSRCAFTFPNVESLFKRYLKLLLSNTDFMVISIINQGKIVLIRKCTLRLVSTPPHPCPSLLMTYFGACQNHTTEVKRKHTLVRRG